MKQFLLACFFLTAISVSAQWNGSTSTNNVISNATGHQSNVQVAAGYNGNTFVCWQDNRNGTDQIYAQRLDANGNALWTSNGLAIAPNATAQVSQSIIADGFGGLYIVWRDARYEATKYDLFAQRIDSNGTVLWDATGIAVCAATNAQYDIALAADSTYGLYVSWTDERDAAKGTEVYVQHMNTTGTKFYTPNGLPINSTNAAENQARILLDQSGNIIVVHCKYIGGLANYDLWGAKVSPTGAILWNTAIISLQGADERPRITTDRNGGAIVTWQLASTGGSGYDIYAQRINATGAQQWGSSGVAVCNALSIQANPEIASDSVGGAIIIWQDSRQGSYTYIYGQRVSSNGVMQWTGNGKAIGFTATNSQQNAQIVANGSNGAVVVWQDVRSAFSTPTTSNDIYAQQINGDGTLAWGTAGAAICNASAEQTFPQLAKTTGGYVITWLDYRSNASNADIYASRVQNNGVLPVKLSSFMGTITTKGNQLTWATSTETNNKGFFVERSADGLLFSSIGFVPARSNGNYSFMDDKDIIQKNYYRLKQVDIDGSIQYSKTILLVSNQKDFIKLYPNPATTNITVTSSQTGIIKVYSADGKLLQQVQNTGNSTNISIAQLKAGNYYIQIGDSILPFTKL